jgi:hypothetical protein
MENELKIPRPLTRTYGPTSPEGRGVDAPPLPRIPSPKRRATPGGEYELSLGF